MLFFRLPGIKITAYKRSKLCVGRAMRAFSDVWIILRKPLACTARPTTKEYRKRNGSGAVYDDPRVAVGAGRFDEVGARAEA